MTASKIEEEDWIPYEDSGWTYIQQSGSPTIRTKEITEMASLGSVNVTYAQGGTIDGGLTVADIWAAFPRLEGIKLDDGYTPQEVAEAQRQFAADVRVAAKRNREDAAYDRIQELQ